MLACGRPQRAPVRDPTATVPTPQHVVVVVLENKNVDQVLGTGNTPYLDHLAQTGADFTNAHAETHLGAHRHLDVMTGRWVGEPASVAIPATERPSPVSIGDHHPVRTESPSRAIPMKPGAITSVTSITAVT